MGCNKVRNSKPTTNMSGVLCTYLFCILCLPLVHGAAFTPLVSRLHSEASVVRAAIEENAVVPSFGLEHLQLASNMLSNLWKSAEENWAATDMPPIKFPAVENAQRFTKYARASSDPTFYLHDCGIGKESFGNESIDTCNNGVFCSVTEIVCNSNGSPVYVIPPANGSTDGVNWSICEVSKIDCIISWFEDHPTTFDVREQWGAKNCTPIPEATVCFDPYSGSSPVCFVQLLCDDFLTFGYNSFGLRCESDSITCGNTTITDQHSSLYGRYQSDIVNGKCQFNQEACVIPYDGNPTCARFNYTCGFQTDLGINYNNSCLLQRYDVPCTQQTSQSSHCTISQVTCAGVVYDTSRPVPNQDDCYVSMISCDGNTVTVNPTGCVPTTLMICNGDETYYSTYTGALSQCVLDQLTCPTQSNCTTLQFACPQAPKCLVTQFPCQVQCQQQMNTTYCVCPDDRTGDQCDKYAPIACDANLFYPPLNCLPSPLSDPNDKLLDGDRKCTVYDNYNSDANLGFMLDCHWYNYAPNPQSEQYNFTYWASSEQISFSEPVQWYLEQKIFNFLQLSDEEALFKAPSITPAQILGEEPVWFNFSLKNIPDKYWFSRRLYYEVAVRNTSGAAAYATAARGFLDAPSRPISTATMSKIDALTVVLIVAGVLVFLGLSGYLGYKYYRFYRKQHPVSRRRN